MEKITFHNGVQMPLEGFGVFQVPDPDVCKKAVLEAIQTGYRLIDTAALYMNEEAVGAAVKEAIDSGLVKREELFITTKLWADHASYEGAKKAFEVSMKKLGLEYLDLYLIHQPYGDVYGAWRAMEELYHAGKIRAIGVCNFYPERITDLALHAEIIPAVNQVELHPFFQQQKAIENMKSFSITPEAWGPFAEGKHGIFTNPILTRIGAKYNKSAAQVALRWNIERGVVVIPKSTHRERMEENINVFDFSLTDEEMKEIATLDLGKSEIVDHSDPAFIRMLSGMKIHD